MAELECSLTDIGWLNQKLTFPKPQAHKATVLVDSVTKPTNYHTKIPYSHHHHGNTPVARKQHHHYNQPTQVFSEHKKPLMSYATLIMRALESSSTGRLTLSEIYQYISTKHPYFRNGGGNWYNSVRHNLSLHSFFRRVKRPRNEVGKGAYWTVDYRFVGSGFKSFGNNSAHPCDNGGTNNGGGGEFEDNSGGGLYIVGSYESRDSLKNGESAEVLLENDKLMDNEIRLDEWGLNDDEEENEEFKRMVSGGGRLEVRHSFEDIWKFLENVESGDKEILKRKQMLLSKEQRHVTKGENDRQRDPTASLQQPTQGNPLLTFNMEQLETTLCTSLECHLSHNPTHSTLSPTESSHDSIKVTVGSSCSSASPPCCKTPTDSNRSVALSQSRLDDSITRIYDSIFQNENSEHLTLQGDVSLEKPELARALPSLCIQTLPHQPHNNPYRTTTTTIPFDPGRRDGIGGELEDMMDLTDSFNKIFNIDENDGWRNGDEWKNKDGWMSGDEWMSVDGWMSGDGWKEGLRVEDEDDLEDFDWDSMIEM